MIGGPAEASTWRRWREALRVCLSARSLRSTLAVALVVGTVLSAINQLDVVVAGRATGRVWLKAALTYLEQGERAAVEAIPSIEKAVFATEDFKEGIQSFIERREAHFQGR